MRNFGQVMRNSHKMAVIWYNSELSIEFCFPIFQTECRILFYSEILTDALYLLSMELAYVGIYFIYTILEECLFENWSAS